jgi:hypothetical protein
MKTKRINWILRNQALLYGNADFWSETELTLKSNKEVADLFKYIKQSLTGC